MVETTMGIMSAAMRRAAQARKEESVLMCAIVACILVLPMAPFGSLQTPLYAVLLALCLFLVVVSIAASRRPFDTSLVVLGAAMFAYLTAHMVADGGGASERLIQCALMVSVLIAASRFEWNQGSIRALNRALTLVVVASAAYWIVSGRVTNYYAAFYGHSNGFANVLICAIAVKIIEMLSRNGRRIAVWDIAYFGICAILLSFANSRSAIFTVAAMIASFAVLALVGRKRRTTTLAIALFVGAAAIMLAFSVVYPSLYGTPLGTQLELLSREYLNKNFFSGREVVWNMVLHALRGHELFGLGLSMEPSMIYNTTFSSHNLYLQTMLQSGIIGLVFVFLILLVVISRLSKHTNLIAYLGIALVIGIVVHEGFEVTLTQNNFSYGVMYWMVMGLSMAICERSWAVNND